MFNFRIIGACPILLSMAVPSNAQDGTRAEALTYLEEAREARELAEQALERAREAETRAMRLLGKLDLAQSSPGLNVTKNDARAGFEGAAASSHANSDVQSTTPTNLLAIYCDNKTGSELSTCQKERGETLTNFTRNDLLLTKIKHFRDSQGVGFRIVGGKDSGYAQIGPVLTFRKVTFEGDNYRPSAFRFEPSLRAKVGDDGSATLGTISGGDFTSGADWGFGFDFRWTRAAEKPLADTRPDIEEMLQAVESACRADKPDRKKCPQGKPSKPFAREQYLKSLGRLYGVTEKGEDVPPKMFAGLQATYNFQREKFFPLTDPGELGVKLLDSLPPDLVGSKEDGTAASSHKFEPFTVKAYGGFAFGDPEAGWNLGLAASFGYQEAVRYPKDKQDVTLCYDDLDPDSQTTGFARCNSINIAAPFSVEGITAGAGFNLMPPETILGRPQLGLLASYFEGTDQWKLSIPLAFAVGSDNKLKAGIRAEINSDGETPFGTKIEGKDTIGIFLEHDLTFPFVP